MGEKKSDLKTQIKAFDLDAYGRNRNEAVTKCFTKLKNEVYGDSQSALINMQVIDVQINEEKEETKIEKLFGYFMPKERHDYYINLKIICEIKYL